MTSEEQWFFNRPVGMYKTYIFSSPDGEDCAKKTVHSTKVFGIVGVVVGMHKYWFNPLGAKSQLIRTGQVIGFGVPAAAAGTVYAAALCISSHVRGGKDDALNHLLAGTAAAGLFGAKYHSGNVMLAMAAFLGLGGAILKLCRPVGEPKKPLRKEIYGAGFSPEKEYYGRKSWRFNDAPPEHY